jgi:hypothetical protein
MDGCKAGLVDGWVDGWMDGLVDGWVNRSATELLINQINGYG